MRKKELILDGLNCAHCATKIENETKKLNNISKANLNFSTRILTIEVVNNDFLDEVISNVKNIIQRLEPDVVVKDKKIKYKKNKSNIIIKKEIYKIIIGIILLSSALLLQTSASIKFILFITSYFIIGIDVLNKAKKNILNGNIFDENFLMSISTIGAVIIGEYPEAIAVMLFYKIGEYFQSLAVNRSRSSISDLLAQRPDYANLKTETIIKKVSPEQVPIGSIIIIQPSEKVPIDGIVINGTSFVDTKALTGESVPRNIKVGNKILSGMINQNSVLTVKTTKLYSESTINKILNLVENASSKKAKTEQFVTKFAKYYTPIVVLIALFIAIIPPLLTGKSFNNWVYKALVFLVISCPCALVISVPLGFFGGIGCASKKGILIKGGNYLEALCHVNTVVFDKTGTLTKGVFDVTKIIAMQPFTKEDIIKFAAYAEYYSNHPIATSIKKTYDHDIDEKLIDHYNEIAGYGIKATIKKKHILIGNKKLMDKENISFTKADEIGTIIYVTINHQYAGYILISDKIKKDAKIAINKIKELGVKETIMLTGDHSSIAKQVSQHLGINKTYSDLLPHEKVSKLEYIKETHKVNSLVFIGDGMNDAPVLAIADVGIAMGGLGSDSAIEAADIVFMTDEPSKLASAILIARKTKRIILQNIFIALFTKFLVLLLGVLDVATMWEAVFADVGVTLIAIFNSIRVLYIKDQ